MSNMTILPQKFDGNSRYLDSFFVQFEIACQINSWPENQKHYWLIRCLNGHALSYITDILQYIPVVDYAILKQALYQSYDLPQASYKVAFNNRTLHEGENVVEYGWDLKYLATKAYPDQLIELLQPLIIKQFINGLGIKDWSEHVLFHCPCSLQEAIDIAIERKTFSDCHVCRQNSKYNLFHNVHATEPRYDQSNKCYYKLTKQTTKNHRFKPYAVSKVHSYRKACTKFRPRPLAEVQQEHRQLQSSVSSEDHYAWDLVEVVVEIPCSDTCNGVSTQHQLSHVQSTSQIHDDLFQNSPQEGNGDLSLSVESALDMSCQAGMFHMCGMCEDMKQPSSDYHSIQSPLLFKGDCRAVRNLKCRAYDNSRGDYSPNISLNIHMPMSSQTCGSLIRCWKRDFPD